MAEQFDVTIEKMTIPAPDHVEMILGSTALSKATPGQYAHILTPGTLRRPISFSRLNPATHTAAILFQVIGAGTAWLATRKVGDLINVMGPLGKGFDRPLEGRPWCLVGGGVGIPPLYAAVQRWHEAAPATVILGARNEALLLMEKDFDALGVPVSVATDDGSRGFAGSVMEPLREWLHTNPEGQVYACGPTPMLRAVAAEVRGRPAWLALEQRMGCGIGACLACVVPVHGGNYGGPYERVCTEGPVFAADHLQW